MCRSCWSRRQSAVSGAARCVARPSSALVGHFRRSLRGQRPPTLARSLAQSRAVFTLSRRRTAAHATRQRLSVRRPFVSRVVGSLLYSFIGVSVINLGRIIFFACSRSPSRNHRRCLVSLSNPR